MSKFELKPLAEKLRISGKSINEIAKELSLSKSTVSVWCSGINISEKLKNDLRKKMIDAGMIGRLRGAEVNKQKKIDSIYSAKKWASENITLLSRNDFVILLTALYWAEGGKTDSTSGFVFVNSDPEMIILVYWILRIYLNLEKSDFLPRISINFDHKDRSEKVLKFWSNLLELPEESFGNITYIKSKHKKMYFDRNSYNGVLRLRVKGSMQLKYRILALIKEVKLKSQQLLA